MNRAGRVLTRIVSMFTLLVLTGCAFGTKMSFQNTSLAIPSARGDVAVAVWDSRPVVISGDKSPQWVGLQRSGFGIPYGVHTSSGQPLRKEFASSINTSLSRAGSVTTTVEIPDKTPNESSVQRLLPTTGKVVLLQIAQWKTDTTTDIHFDYDLQVSVLKNGKTIATERAQGNEKLAGSFWNPIGASERVAVAKQKEKLESLFARPTIAQALAQ